MAKTSKKEAPPAPQPPYLKRVRLRNVPPLRDVQADFQPGLNIIIGKNGSGKTNFMKLLSELADLYQDKYRGVGSEIFLDVLSKEIRIELVESKPVQKSIHIPPHIRNFLPLTTVAHDKKKSIGNQNLFVAIVSLLQSQSFGEMGYGYELLSIWHGLPNHPLAIIDKATDLSFDSNGTMSTEGPESIWGQSGVLERALIRAVLHRFGWVSRKGGPVEANAIHASITDRITSRLDELNAYLPVYSPIERVRLNQQFQVYLNSTKDEIIVKGIMLEYLIDSDWLPFSVLSDGTKRLFYMIGELIPKSSYYDSETEDFLIEPEGDKIIFLEEPELGIHPDQLQLLLQLIREVSTKHQVIMTTHSPQTLDMLSGQELDRITICEFIPGKGTQMRKLSAAKKAKAKAYLRDDGFLSEFWRFSDLEKPD